MDNAHAHPSPPNVYENRPRARRTHNITPPRISPPQNRQQRLLRSRNARFPAKKLSLSGISARFSQLIRSNESTSPPETPPKRSNENVRSRRSKGPSTVCTSSPSLGVLEEVTASIGSYSRRLQKRKESPDFTDSPTRALLQVSPIVSPSIYHDASSAASSPRSLNQIYKTPQKMGLREISGNARRVSSFESPPYASISKTNRRRKTAQNNRFNSEEYIEHIERELQLVKEAMYSPNTNRPWKEKLKAAKTENERLRKEIMETKTAFELEVQKTVEHMTSTEIGLRRKIRLLEEESERKDFLIHDLECQHEEKRLSQGTIETLKTAIEMLEQEKAVLEESNQSLSKRNEVLTELLALSPTKASQEFDLSTPIRTRKNARPQSVMIPRLPSSPNVRFTSRPQSLVVSPASGATHQFSPRLGSYMFPVCDGEEDPQKELEDQRSVDSGLGESCSLRSVNGPASRRSTIGSQGSVSVSYWGLPQSLSPSIEQPTTRQQSRRTARKFVRGSTQLKPLLLPVLTAESGVLHSSPLASPSRRDYREVSEESLDPTTTFLSKVSVASNSGDESWPNVEGDHSFDGKRNSLLAFQSFEDIINDHDELEHTICGIDTMETEAQVSADKPFSVDTSTACQCETTLEGVCPSVSCKSAQTVTSAESISDPEYSQVSKGRNAEEVIVNSQIIRNEVEYSAAISTVTAELLCRLPSVEIPAPLFSPDTRKSPPHNEAIGTPSQNLQLSLLDSPNSSNNLKRRKSSSSSIVLDAQLKRMPLHSSALVQNRLKDSPNLTPFSIITALEIPVTAKTASVQSIKSYGRPKSPLELLQERNFGPQPIAAVTIQTIYGTLSRYTTYIRDFRKDPLALARRVVTKIWRANWAIVGKLSWWVLGLFISPTKLHQQDIPGDWDDYDGESIADRYCRYQVDDSESQLSQSRLSNATSNHNYPRKTVDSAETIDAQATETAKAAEQKSTWRESVYLWGKFSVAIMLAVTGAVVKGPAEMLREMEAGKSETSAPIRRTALNSGQTTNSDLARDQELTSNANVTTMSVVPSYQMANSNSPDRSYRYQKYRRQEFSSPAGRLLREDTASSPQQVSPSPLYKFGQRRPFIFNVSPIGHNRREWDDDNTLKPMKSGRKPLDRIFSSLRQDMRESDPETPGPGLYVPSDIG